MKNSGSFFTNKLGETILKNFPIVLSIIVVLMLAFGSWGQVLTTTTYSTAGTFTWVVPTCVTSVTVRVWGAGGGGSGASSGDLNGGGGGGGAFCIKTETVTPGETLRITVGAGGAGGSGANGNNGGFSQVEHLTGSIVFCRAAGGARGMKSSCSTCSGAGGSGGLIGNNIPVNTGFSGGNGGSSDPNTSIDKSGGGGGGAGSGSAGGNGGIVTAGIAGSPGGGVGGVGVSSTTTSGLNGNPGVILGGGGGGATTFTGSTTGGAGARGQVTITYVATGCEPSQSMFTYSTPGTYSWVVPACVNFVTVEAWGGGGGGGNVAILKTSGSGTETCTGAGGGGGGGYAARTYAVSPGQTYTIVVGAGGAAGTVGAGSTSSGITTLAGTGGTGQSSSFSGPATVGPGTLTATGGNGGGGAGGYSTVVGACVLGNGVAGTAGTGVNGSLNYTGGSGVAGLILDHSTDKSGGGGGAAGPGGNGGNATPAGSVGTAASPGGIGNPPGGNGGNGLLYNTTGTYTGNGLVGGSIGGGGGGSLIHTGAIGVFTATGGAGARGEVRLTYNTSCPLPIELVEFKGLCKMSLIHISWSTVSEFGNDYFILEQSQNGTDFVTVDYIDGAGNSTSALTYLYELNNHNGNYFRLKQVDFDGAFTYSDIIYVGCDDSDDQSIFFPNPFDDELNIDLSGIDERFLVAILDVNGRLIKSAVQGELKSTNAMKIDLSELAKGIYYIELLSADTNDLLKKGKVVKL